MSSSIVYVVALAAGEGRRFGSPKQLANLAGKSLLARSGEISSELRFSLAQNDVDVHSLLVLGAHHDIIEPSLDLSHWDSVEHCCQWEQGLRHSIANGFTAALESQPELSGCLLLLVDQPLVSSTDLKQLVLSGLEKQRITCAAYPDSVGVPAFFPIEDIRCFLEDMGDADEDSAGGNVAKTSLAQTSLAQTDVAQVKANGLQKGGAKQFILSRPHLAQKVEGVLKDIDTPDDLLAVERVLESCC